MGLITASEKKHRSSPPVRDRLYRLSVSKSVTGCPESHDVKVFHSLPSCRKIGLSGRKKCSTLEMFPNWCSFFRFREQLVSFPSSFENYFLCKHQTNFFTCGRLCVNDSTQNNPYCSHTAHALLIFLAYCSWRMLITDFLFTRFPLSGPCRKATWSNIW